MESAACLLKLLRSLAQHLRPPIGADRNRDLVIILLESVIHPLFRTHHSASQARLTLATLCVHSVSYGAIRTGSR